MGTATTDQQSTDGSSLPLSECIKIIPSVKTTLKKVAGNDNTHWLPSALEFCTKIQGSLYKNILFKKRPNLILKWLLFFFFFFFFLT